VCANKARDVLPPALLAGAAHGDADRPLTLRETKQLMVPLIRLRQACCHPQAGALVPHVRCTILSPSSAELVMLVFMACMAMGHVSIAFHSWQVMA